MTITVRPNKNHVYRCDETGCTETLELISYYKRETAVEHGWYFEGRRTLCPHHAPRDSMIFVKRNRYGRAVVWYTYNASHVFYRNPMEIMQLAERILRQVVIPESRDPNTFSLLEDEA